MRASIWNNENNFLFLLFIVSNKLGFFSSLVSLANSLYCFQEFPTLECFTARGAERYLWRMGRKQGGLQCTISKPIHRNSHVTLLSDNCVHLSPELDFAFTSCSMRRRDQCLLTRLYPEFHDGKKIPLPLDLDWQAGILSCMETGQWRGTIRDYFAISHPYM